MPYLHWEEVARLDQAKKVIRDVAELGGIRVEDLQTDGWTKDQKLINAYLCPKIPHKLHTFHIRRTLDQFHYHTLPNTDNRDENQTVTRYQRRYKERKPNDEDPAVLSMVDQLWMWVLVGPSGKADTVITCFPSRDLFHSSAPDRTGYTDIFQNVLIHTLNEPHAVKSAYDLAGIITSQCSRSFLRHSGAEHYLQFSKIYETAISDIVC
jgi:hypothetical protein